MTKNSPSMRMADGPTHWVTKEPVTTYQAERVLVIAGEAIDLFLRRNRDYGDAAEELGPKAQFVDMNRKFRKLKRGLWEGEELVGESTREICMDLIGHCLLTIDMLDRTTDLS